MNKFDEKRKKRHDRECSANEMTFSFIMFNDLLKPKIPETKSTHSFPEWF